MEQKHCQLYLSSQFLKFLFFYLQVYSTSWGIKIIVCTLYLESVVEHCPISVERSFVSQFKETT